MRGSTANWDFLVEVGHLPHVVVVVVVLVLVVMEIPDPFHKFTICASSSVRPFSQHSDRIQAEAARLLFVFSRTWGLGQVFASSCPLEQQVQAWALHPVTFGLHALYFADTPSPDSMVAP